MKNYNPITDGLLKAMHLIATQGERRKVRKRFDYEDDGAVVHLSHCLTLEERNDIAKLLRSIQVSEDADEKRKLIGQLRRRPVKIVPIRHQSTIDYTRYPGNILRDIRASGGGAKEKARARARAAKISVTSLAA